jgi:hypothetical protein
LTFFIFIGFAGEIFCEPPGIFLNFGCVKRTGDMRLEWFGDMTSCTIARMFFDISVTNDEQFLWQLQAGEIETAIKSCKSNAIELTSLENV